MRATCFHVVLALGLFSAFAIAPIAARQATQPSAPAAPPSEQSAGQPAGQPGQPSQSGYVLKVKTRLVTVDVVAKDAHGNIVRDLKPEELQVLERSKPQKVSAFEFVDRLANGTVAKPPASSPISPAIYSNTVRLEGLTIPPTVLLMDAVNSPLQDQMQARSQMIRLLKTLPQNTPIAVFLLGGSLRLVQGFTSDPALLQTAVNKLTQADTFEKNPIDDPNGASNAILAANGGDETDVTQEVEDFEKEQNAETVDIQAQLTLGALKQIARYLSGIPGRKNLIWLSESFPLTIWPDLDNGSNSFAGTRNYGPEVQAATNALSDAQVAIYPVDLRGMQTDQSCSASQQMPNIGVSGARGRGGRGGRGGPPPASLAGPCAAALQREEKLRIDTQQTMEKLAEETGGETCTNTNDLSGCVETAVKDGSSYYELGFYPQNTEWDGRFHQFTVKTTRRGITLTYRGGYFALDASSLAKEQNPDEYLRQACSDLLPSTAIHVVARTVLPAEASGEAEGTKYLLVIDPGALNIAQQGDSYKLNVQAAACQFPHKGDAFRFDKQDLTRTVPNDTFQLWQAHGIPDYITIAPNADINRIRFAVLDVTTGLTGALDIMTQPPAKADSSQTAPAAPVAAPAPETSAAVAPMILKTTPVLAIPDNSSQSKSVDHLTFRGSSGQAGTLAWTDDSLAYQGDLAIGQSAPAFFGYAFGARFRCQAGALVPADAAGGEPKLQLIFWDSNGKSATVDLKGAQPEYSGDLPVDASARTFFDQVWQLSHCRAQ